jgi:hypothetical protein
MNTAASCKASLQLCCAFNASQQLVRKRTCRCITVSVCALMQNRAASVLQLVLCIAAAAVDVDVTSVTVALVTARWRSALL